MVAGYLFQFFLEFFFLLLARICGKYKEIRGKYEKMCGKYEEICRKYVESLWN